MASAHALARQWHRAARNVARTTAPGSNAAVRYWAQCRRTYAMASAIATTHHRAAQLHRCNVLARTAMFAAQGW